MSLTILLSIFVSGSGSLGLEDTKFFGIERVRISNSHVRVSKIETELISNMHNEYVLINSNFHILSIYVTVPDF